MCNIKITWQAGGAIMLESLGSSKFSEGIISFMETRHQQSYWEKGNSEIIESNTHKKFGLQADEDNLLCTLDRNIVNTALNQVDNGTHAQGEVTSDLDKFLTSDQIAILWDLCTELKNAYNVKWEHIQPSTLFPDILENPGEMYLMCTIKDLQAISKVLSVHTGQCWYSSKLSKAQNINNIVAAFDANSDLETTQFTWKLKTLKSLLFSAKEFVKNQNYPTMCLCISFATACLKLKQKEWNGHQFVETYCHIPNADSTEAEHVMEFFSIPEYNPKRDKVEFCPLDYTHMLTNMHSHILTRGYDFCPTHHYRDLADNWPDIISQAIVYDQADLQSAFFMMQMFTKEVEEYFVKRFHRKCCIHQNSQRMAQSLQQQRVECGQQIQRLYAMHDFLLKDVDRIPPQHFRITLKA